MVPINKAHDFVLVACSNHVVPWIFSLWTMILINQNLNFFTHHFQDTMMAGFPHQGSYIIASVRPFVCLSVREQDYAKNFPSDFHETLSDCGLALWKETVTFSD